MQTPSDSQLVARILSRYDLVASDILPYEAGYRNRSYPVRLTDGRPANLILYKIEPGIVKKIRSANAVSNYLAANGFPTRRTLDHRVISLGYNGKVKYGAIYDYLPGATIPWEAYSKNHIKVLGLAMSRMHTSLRGSSDLIVPTNVADTYVSILGRMQHYFCSAAVQTALSAKLVSRINSGSVARFGTVLASCRSLPDQQILHMDFVRSNILFGQSVSKLEVGNVHISGILDFEKTAFGHPSFDIARTLAFLLVDCKNKTENKIRHYFLVSGYNKRGDSSYRNVVFRRAGHKSVIIEELINFFLLYDFYKFLIHNPYEFLAENEHFVRTRDLLIGRGLVEITTSVPQKLQQTRSADDRITIRGM